MNIYDIWFCSAPLSYKVKINLIKFLKNTENIWYYSVDENLNYFEDTKNEGKLKRVLQSAWNKEKFKEVQDKMERNEIQHVTILDREYPKHLLEHFEEAPYAIFFKGNLEVLDHKCVSVVGSRNCTQYGINITNLIVEELNRYNITIVSGLAKGIDSVAHRKTVEMDGCTCAVLGCGIDIVYPRENKALYGEILKKGCILSEFLPGTPPYAHNFPIRNRIISALSHTSIVIEANKKSGSLITASAALEQGKNVMAVPGSVFSEQSKGTNQLIREGAHVFTCMEDVFQLLDLKYQKEVKKNPEKLSLLQSKICKAISNQPIHIDDIIKITNIDIQQLYEVLFEMQLRNEIICLAGNYYARVMHSV